jgi:ATP/maltotriose-dependent transcriptional regulator MalT
VAFFHASIREYFYARLEPDRRGALHARAAEWYAKAGHARESGYHRERAGLVDVR